MSKQKTCPLLTIANSRRRTGWRSQFQQRQDIWLGKQPSWQGCTWMVDEASTTLAADLISMVASVAYPMVLVMRKPNLTRPCTHYTTATKRSKRSSWQRRHRCYNYGWILNDGALEPSCIASWLLGVARENKVHENLNMPLYTEPYLRPGRH